MVNRRRVLHLAAATAAAGVAARSQGVRSAKERIVGVYRLARVVRRTADGQETIANANPTGRLSYDSAGRVWVLLAPAGRKAAVDPRNITLEEYKAMNAGLMAYFGSYEVDEANQKLIIHIEAAANPALSGTTIERVYKLTDTTLTMTVPGNPATDNVFERLAG
jgi:Lipocalin-like domain